MEGYEPPLKLLIFRDNPGAKHVSDSAALQEVDDAVRQDDLRAFWTRWGTWIVAAAVVVVVGVAGFTGWRKYTDSQRAVAGAAYSAALAKVGQDNAGARVDFEKQAADALEPYRSLARLLAAQLRDTPAEQATALSEVGAALSSTELADLAAVMAALKSVDSGKADEMIAKLEPLAADGRPYRLSVRELQAMNVNRKGDTKRARELWNEIVKDPGAPQGAAQRAQAMLNLNGGPVAAEGAK